jgi:hypothetical protein
MANTVIALKKSATPSAAPTNLANGELAINYADGKLFYKAANGTISSISGNEPNYFGTVNANNTLVIADTPGDIFTIAAGKNIDINGDAVNDKLIVSLTNDVTVPGLLSVTAASGDEGGEIRLANAITNSLLSGPVNIDIFRNQLRFFVAGGDARGAFINLAATSAGVGTDLLAAATSTDAIARATASQAFDKANAALPNVSGTWFNGTLTASQNLVADKIISTNNGDGENFKVGDDAWIGDTNLANALRIKGQQNSSIGYVMFGPNDGKLLGRAGTDSLTYDGNILWHAGNSANASQAFDKANTANITADRAWSHANAAFANGNTTIQTAQSAFTQANLAFIHANNAFASANAGQASANAGQSTANAAFNRANTANITADRAWNHANAAFITANIAFANANTVMISTQAAFTVANSGFIHANAAFAFANSISITANLAFTHANAAFANGNTVIQTAQSAFTQANLAFIHANNAFANANTVMVSAQAAFTVANNSFLHSNAAYAFANSITITANLAFAHANAAFANGNTVIQTAQSAFTQANLAFVHANAAHASSNAGLATANAAITHANQAFDKANTANITADRAWNHANAAFISANIAFANANTVMISAQAAFTVANSGFLHANSGYAFANSIAITANLAFAHANLAFANGNTVIQTAQSAFNQANLAFIHANNAFASANAGQASGNAAQSTANAAFNRANTANITADRAWNHANAAFANANTVMVSAQAAFTVANSSFIHANSGYAFANSIALTANAAFLHANAAFANANTVMISAQAAFTVANSSFLHANAAYAFANSIAITANLAFAHANAAFANANTVIISAQSAFTVANSGFLHANSGYAFANSIAITANLAFAHANAAFANGNTVIQTAQSAFTLANNAYLHSNAAHASANAGMSIANGAFASANAGQATANAAFNRANNSLLSSSYTAADVLAKLITVDGAGTTLDADLLDGQQGTYYGIAADVTAAFNKANTANITADRAWNHANAAFASANIAFANANTVMVSAQAAFTVANSAFLHANSGYAFANSISITANLAFAHANAAFANGNTVIQTAQSAFTQANTARDHANGAFASANAGQASANAGQSTANAAFARANTANITADRAWNHANAAFDVANTSGVEAEYAFLRANLAHAHANASYAFANSAHSIANLAFAHANAAFLSSNGVNTYTNSTYVKLTASSQTITGDVNIVGALTLSGNTVFIDATRLEIDDPLIYLAGNNYTSDIVDIGFIANYVNATGQNVHTGLYREHENKEYYLFQGYDKEPANNHIGAFSNNMTLAVLNADIRTSNLILGGVNAISTIGASFNHANAAHASANAGMAIANGAFASANAGQATANAAFTRANNSLLSSSYTAADVLAKLITVDGAGTTLDADLLDGQQGSYYGIASDVVAAFLRANNSLLSSSYTAADVLAKLITVDGAGTTLDADLLDGQQGSYYGIASDVVAAFLRANNSLLSSSYTAADVLAKLITVDGAGTTLDADLLDGQQGSYYGISTDVSAANRVANAAFLHANAAFATANIAFANANTVMISAQAAFTVANSGFVHANAAFTQANAAIASASAGQATANAAFARANNSLLSSSYTAADVLAKLITVDGAGTTLDADLLDGQQGTYYGIASDVTAAFLRANNSLLSSSYTAADVLAKLITVDGAGTTLDADLLDGQQGTYYGIATDVTAANRVANAAFLHANAGYAFANSSHSIANLAFTHANNAYATANGRVSSVSGTGTVSGITLSGTVTTSGSLTLGGTLSASIIDNMSDEHRLFNNMGDNHATRTAFDLTGPSINFGWRFVQGSANGPGVTGTQFYTEYLGLGNEYPATGAGSYGMQIAYPRNVTEPYITIRYNEANTFTAWQKVSAGNSDKLGGQAGSYYGIASDVTAAFLRANNSLLSSSYTAADVLAKLITVDGAGTNLDADLLDGQQGSYYGIATDVAAANRVANAAFLHANSSYAFANSIAITANLAFAHANVAFANGNTVIQTAQSAFNQANLSFIHANNAYARANSSLLSSSYTAADVLAKLITVDGAGTTLDADLLDGQQGSYYGIASDVTAAFLRANNSLLSSSYTAADVLAKLITVDGAGTNLDADLLDGQQGSYYGIAADVTAAFLRANNSLLSSSYTAADVLSKLITVDGAGTNLDADLLDGQQGSYYGIATDVVAANRVANAAFLHANAAFIAANADYAFSNSAHSIANLAFVHANAAFAKANTAGGGGASNGKSIIISMIFGR